MIEVGMFEAKTNFSRLIEDLVLGKTDYISILKNRRPVARIIVETPDRKVRFGTCRKRWPKMKWNWEAQKSLDAEIAAEMGELA